MDREEHGPGDRHLRDISSRQKRGQQPRQIPAPASVQPVLTSRPNQLGPLGTPPGLGLPQTTQDGRTWRQPVGARPGLCVNPIPFKVMGLQRNVETSQANWVSQLMQFPGGCQACNCPSLQALGKLSPMLPLEDEAKHPTAQSQSWVPEDLSQAFAMVEDLEPASQHRLHSIKAQTEGKLRPEPRREGEAQEALSETQPLSFSPTAASSKALSSGTAQPPEGHLGKAEPSRAKSRPLPNMPKLVIPSAATKFPPEITVTPPTPTLLSPKGSISEETKQKLKSAILSAQSAANVRKESLCQPALEVLETSSQESSLESETDEDDDYMDI
ncbi:hypothetical protein P7K49_002621 [Saguinus oedipus]|uniref:Calcineurin-binding protein cabin-1 MEF2-binding domain-containing protein n=1 Tax=Saguinus oedipus TaxID=9490 RepID=A0ABQ9WHU2_SAGOE|nr:hypothetical protein P7K49_002621 [Saguinus oedipus]